MRLVSNFELLWGRRGVLGESLVSSFSPPVMILEKALFTSHPAERERYGLWHMLCSHRLRESLIDTFAREEYRWSVFADSLR